MIMMIRLNIWDCILKVCSTREHLIAVFNSNINKITNDNFSSKSEVCEDKTERICFESAFVLP